MYQSVKENKKCWNAASHLVQVVDQHRTPLAVLNLAQVRRQKLLHQAVHLLAYTTGQRLCLNSTWFGKKNCWELAGSTLVEAEESGFTAAERLCMEYAGKHFSLVRQASFFDADSFQFLDVYRFSFSAEKIFSEHAGKHLMLDRIEFERIFTDYPAMLGPNVSRLWQLGVLFSERA